MSANELTAEQVRKAVMSADRWEKPMGNTGLVNTHLIIRDDGWQAIADELNAKLDTRAERTCKNVGERCDFACSECGARLYTETSDGYTMILGDEETILLNPNYCPNCGARVVE